MIQRRYLKGSGLLLVLLILFSACGATAQPSQTAADPGATAKPSQAAAHPLDVKIVTYSASVTVQTPQPTPVSASCKPGEQMIGGGFSASDLFEYAAFIDASYPSSPSAWTVAGVAGSIGMYFDLAVEVYCVSASLPLGVQIVQSSAGSITCPQGTSVLSGGFQNAQPIAASYPHSNGWVSVDSERVYSLCASQHFQSGMVVTSTFNAHSSAHGYYPGGGGAACPAGQVATGGGFDSHGDLILDNTLNAPPHAGWSVGAGGDADVMVSALCGVFEA